jgi:hypothetical protein
MAEVRPAIPEAIKREVRQQCCFGCAICGMPFFQYDHIVEYSEVNEHTTENLVLLCPNHHAAKTTNKLSRARIQEAKKNPFNRTRAKTSGFRVEPSKELITMLGSNTVTGWYPSTISDHHPVWINGQSFFIIHSNEGWLSVSLVVTDQYGEFILVVERGELVVSTTAWDYVYEGDNIKIRRNIGDVILDLNLSNSRVQVRKGMFMDGSEDGFEIKDGALLGIIDGKLFSTIKMSSADSNGFGGFGLLNSKLYPDVKAPGGFGFFVGSEPRF